MDPLAPVGDNTESNRSRPVSVVTSNTDSTALNVGVVANSYHCSGAGGACSINSDIPAASSPEPSDPPTVTLNSLLDIDSSYSSTSYSFSGTCSENNRAVEVTIGSLGPLDAPCVELAWTLEVEMRSLPEERKYNSQCGARKFCRKYGHGHRYI